MAELNKRQQEILLIIQKNKKASNREIKEKIEQIFGQITRMTIVRDLELLLKDDLIIKNGSGRNVHYEIKQSSPLLEYFDIEKYFKTELDKRIITNRFNFDIFKKIDNHLISKNELAELDKLNKKYHQRIKKLSPAIIKREFERLIIELSWKSSAIEGNTYSLLETETLIKENKEATGHKKEEALMILNHKKAIDYIKDEKSKFKSLNLRKIEDIHSLLTADLIIKKGLRNKSVGITGTNYKPLDNQYQIKDAMEKLVKMVNKIKNPITKALILVLMISYLQPFEDGNKRTARISANAILLAHNYCPLSYSSVDETEYKKALVIFYEQNSALYFKELFVAQYKQAINNYFQ